MLAQVGESEKTGVDIKSHAWRLEGFCIYKSFFIGSNGRLFEKQLLK
jgi:hypothetical protein